MDRAEILELLRERIVSFAASRLSREGAEDVTQDVFIVLEEKYAHLERMEDLLPLSLRIVRLKLMGARRKIARRGEYARISVEDIPLADPDPLPDEIAERREIVERLKRALPKLGGRCRELLKHKLQGRTFPEIRELMHAGSINTVYTWDLRCRKRLLELMGGSWENK